MCLYTKQICPQRARKDIVCYKEFTRSIVQFYMITPYLRQYVLRPTKNNPTLMDDTDLNVEANNTTIKYGDGRTCEFRRIGRGMIHAYTYPIKTAACCFLYKCIIPKGTLYYKGINNNICAKKMLIVEQMICGSQVR